MPATIWRFVDQPTASPTVLLDMNDGLTWKLLGNDFFKLPSPPLRRSVATNAMSDGGVVSSASYDLRTITFTLELTASTEAGREAQVDALKAQLAKPSNLLMFQSELSANPVFFRTLRSDEYDLNTQFVPTQRWRIDCTVMAEPFAIGIRRDIAQVTVTNDPAAPGPVLNSNTSFEVNTVGWTGIGGTLTRSTAQFHAGVASGTITPDGVTATVRIDGANVAVTGGTTYRAKGWVRCAVARSVSLNINWYDSGSTYITTGTGSVSVVANTWTFISTDMVAPSNAAFANIIPTLSGTPPATNILWVDEIELRATAVSGSTYFDMTGIVGDSPTPAFVRLQGLGAGGSAILSQRSVNNPTAVTLFGQSEAATLGTDTTTWSNTIMSGNAGTATSFATSTLVTRLTFTLPTATSPEALRGRYRVFLRVHTGGTTADYVIRYVQNSAAGQDGINGPQVSYHANTVWQFLDLGVVDFPAFPAPAGVGYSGLPPALATTSLAIQASRANGADNLDIDYVYLLPADERMCWIRQTAAVGYAVIDGPNDATYGMAAGSSPFSATLASRVVDNAGGLVSRFGSPPVLMPGVTNRWYLLVDQQDITTTKTVDVSYWPRWREVATS